MTQNHQASSPSVKEIRKRFEQQNPEASNLEGLYTKVNKPHKRQHDQETGETVYAPQNPPETAYAPQNPPETAYAIQGGMHPFQEPEHVYAEVDFSPQGRSPKKPEPVYAEVDFSPQGRSPKKPEPVYAEVDFSPQGRSPKKPESVYAEIDFSPQGEPSPQEPEHVYAEVDFSPQGRSPKKPENVHAEIAFNAQGEHSLQNPEHVHATQEPVETIYVSQNPPESAYAIPRPQKLVDPYLVTDLFEPHGRPDSQRLENSLYDTVGGGARGPQKPEYVYATVDMGAQGEQESLQRENPIYEGIASGRTTPPPRSQKDEITTKLLQNTDFQSGVKEIQQWSKVVYGDEHALNKQLAAILDNPQEGEKVLWDLAANPESGGKLAGRKMLGIKSPDRKQAEEGFSPLCSALEKHVETTQKLHRDFTREQTRHQSHERGGSPERHAHEHHHHAREAHQHSQEHEAQQRRHREERGMAFAM
ncbi:BID domain-containing T4SS effector [Bartonella heixiaziensis]|uniref:BID domain-containing T4SS effector n=1 Tax=Bartonella heixiaziensis TaxID=1461000 RepID=UPI003D200CD7